MSSFSNKILIEQAERDRLQQRQLREYSPELGDGPPFKQYDGYYGVKET